MTEKVPQLVPLNDREIRAARMEAEGVVMREIANAVGIHRKTLYRWRDKPAYVAFVRDLRADAQRAARLTLEAGATEAARKILQLVRSNDDRVALAAATTLLDRTGHPKTERREIMQAIAARVVTGPADAVADLDAAMARGGADE